MAYTINKTNGTPLVAGGLSDGTIDDKVHTSLRLIGRDYAGYGRFINENFVQLLENFAYGASPANPLTGQLWWDTSNNVLRVYSGTSWKISTGATSSPAGTPPGDLSTLGGDLWFDSTNSQLKVWSGTSWVTIGPTVTPATGNTGTFPAIMSSTGGSNFVVIQLFINGIVYAVFSKDTFASTLAGFPLVKAGITFSTLAAPAWQLSNQDVLNTPSTLVQRDSSGGIAVGAISATSLTTGSSISVTSGSFNGNLNGNVTATTITSGTINTAGITATTGFSGNVLTTSQPLIATMSNVRMYSLGVGTAASGNNGEVRASGSVTQLYSDDRLKNRLGNIENALDKVDQLAGFYYEANETAQALGYEVKREVGLSAQQTNTVMPELIAPAPADDQYMTIRYERFAPLLIEAIKELRAEVTAIKAKLG